MRLKTDKHIEAAWIEHCCLSLINEVKNDEDFRKAKDTIGLVSLGFVHPRCCCSH